MLGIVFIQQYYWTREQDETERYTYIARSQRSWVLLLKREVVYFAYSEDGKIGVEDIEQPKGNIDSGILTSRI